MSVYEMVQEALPLIQKRRQREKAAGEVAPDLLAFAVQRTGGDAGNIRQIATIAAPIAAADARPWAVGMTTEPGDIVLDPAGRFAYIFSRPEPMTHHNHTFFPGAAGVFHWSIIPEMYQGHRVYPNVPGIIVAVQRDQLWWNSERTRLFRWNAVDNAAVVWAPGAPGVHQWTEVRE